MTRDVRLRYCPWKPLDPKQAQAPEKRNDVRKTHEGSATRKVVGDGANQARHSGIQPL